MANKRMTCVFDYDVKSFKGNPHHADTPFGRPVIINDGDLAAENGWQPIETAPRDGAGIDIWCVPFNDGELLYGAPKGVRLTDVSWHDADEIFPHTGWTRCCDDGDWDFVEGPPSCDLGLPAWKPTHWMPLPNPPVTP